MSNDDVPLGWANNPTQSTAMASMLTAQYGSYAILEVRRRARAQIGSDHHDGALFWLEVWQVLTDRAATSKRPLHH